MATFSGDVQYTQNGTFNNPWRNHFVRYGHGDRARRRVVFQEAVLSEGQSMRDWVRRG